MHGWNSCTHVCTGSTGHRAVKNGGREFRIRYRSTVVQCSTLGKIDYMYSMGIRAYSILHTYMPVVHHRPPLHCGKTAENSGSTLPSGDHPCRDTPCGTIIFSQGGANGPSIYRSVNIVGGCARTTDNAAQRCCSLGVVGLGARPMQLLIRPIGQALRVDH